MCMSVGPGGFNREVRKCEWGGGVNCNQISNPQVGISINGVTQNVWFIMEDPIEMDDDWGYPHDLGNLQVDWWADWLYVVISYPFFSGILPSASPCESWDSNVPKWWGSNIPKEPQQDRTLLRYGSLFDVSVM